MFPEGRQESASQWGSDPCLLPRDPWWEEKNADRSFQGLCWAPSEVILLFYLWPFSSWEGFSFMQEQHLLTESSLGMHCLQRGLDAVIVCPIPQEPPWDKSRGKIKNQRCHSNQAIERYIHTHICVCLCMFTIKLAKGLHLYLKPYFNITTAVTSKGEVTNSYRPLHGLCRWSFFFLLSWILDMPFTCV